MRKILLIMVIPVALYAADPMDFIMTTSYGPKASPQRVAVPIGRELSVFPGDIVLPQMAAGGGWTTQIVLVNLSTVRLPFTIDFWKGDGSFWQVAMKGGPTGDRITGSLPPGATTTFETNGVGSLAQGWARLLYDFDVGTIGGFAVLRQSVPGRPDSEAVVPMSSVFDKVIVLPYDNTAGFATGIACVNPLGEAATTVTATIRDEAGLTYATETIQLPRAGQDVFSMPTKFPVTQGRRGTVLFKSSTDYFSVMGLRFNPGGSFTSFSALNTPELNP